MNHSSLQNEENVTFRLTCENGKFNNQYGNGQPSLQLNSYQLVYENFAGILHHGAVPFCDATIIYNPDDLLNKNYESFLMLMFGGKNSPMRSSEYKLRINNLYPSNINDLVFQIDENQLMYEKGLDKGTEEEKVRIILGR